MMARIRRAAMLCWVGLAGVSIGAAATAQTEAVKLPGTVAAQAVGYGTTEPDQTGSAQAAGYGTMEPDQTGSAQAAGHGTTQPDETIAAQAVGDGATEPDETVASQAVEDGTTEPDETVAAQAVGYETTKPDETVTAQAAGDGTTQPDETVAAQATAHGAPQPDETVAAQATGDGTTKPDETVTAQAVGRGTTQPDETIAAQATAHGAPQPDETLAAQAAGHGTTQPDETASAQAAGAGAPQPDETLAAQAAQVAAPGAAGTRETVAAEAESTDAAQSGGGGFFSSILDWIKRRREGVEPDGDGTAQRERTLAMQRRPVVERGSAVERRPAVGQARVEEEKPQDIGKDATPGDVARATRDLIAEIEIIRKAQRIDDDPRKAAESGEDRAPVYAYAKSLEVMEKTARVQRRFGMIPVEVGRMPARDVQPGDVYRHVREIIEELRRVKRQLVIEEQIRPAPPAGDETPPPVYRNLADASFLLDGLVGRPVTSNDLYVQILQVHDEMALIAARLGVVLASDPPKVEGDREPKEIAQQILRATYKIVNLQFRLGMEASGVPDAALGQVTGAEVFDAVNVLLAELVRVKVHLDIQTPHGERREARGRKAAEVFAEAQLAARNLDLLTKAAIEASRLVAQERQGGEGQDEEPAS